MFNKKLAVLAAIVGAIANASVVMAEGPELRMPVLTLDTTATAPNAKKSTDDQLLKDIIGVDPSTKKDKK